MPTPEERARSVWMQIEANIREKFLIKDAEEFEDGQTDPLLEIREAQVGLIAEAISDEP